MTDETKSAVLAWIDAQDGYKNYVGSLDNSEGALNLDGWFNLYELADAIEAAVRERCAKIADRWDEDAQSLHVSGELEETIKSTQEYVARALAGKIRSGK